MMHFFSLFEIKFISTYFLKLKIICLSYNIHGSQHVW